MESSSLDFPQGHPQTPSPYLCFPPSCSLLQSPISAPLQPQSSLTMLCSSSGPLPSPRGTSWLLGTPLWVLGVLFQWYLELRYKWRSWPECWCWCGVHTTTWRQCIWHMWEIGYKGKINNNNNNSYSPWVVYQAILPGAYIPLIGVSTTIFTAVPLLQIRYSLVVILGLNSVSGVQYKDMMIDRWWKVSTGIIDVVKSEV